MPTYPVINKTTGETQELRMTVAEYEKWKTNNPDGDKDWSQGIAGTTYGTPKQYDGFKKVMSTVQKANPGANLSRFT